MLQKIRDWVNTYLPKECQTGRPLNSLKLYMATPKVKHSADIVIGDFIEDGTSEEIKERTEQWGKKYRNERRAVKAMGRAMGLDK